MSEQNRRDFLKSSGAGALALTASSYNRVFGAMEKVGVAFLGVGGRCQQHIDVILAMKEKGLKVEPVAVCDVWDGQSVKGLIKGRGLFPSAERCGLPTKENGSTVTKDYRNVLDKVKEADVVCIAAPDHWHGKMATDAMDAGKHVYLEKPMTRTIAEAHEVVKKAQQTKKVVTIG